MFLATLPTLRKSANAVMMLTLVLTFSACVKGAKSLTNSSLSYTNSTLTTSAKSVLVGGSATLTFTAEDSFGNVLSTFSGPVILTTSGGTSTGALNQTSSSGTPVTMTNNGNGTFSATYTGLSTGNPTSSNLGNGSGSGSSQTLTASYSGNVFSNTASIYVVDTPPTLTPYMSSNTTYTYSYSNNGDEPFISQGSPVILGTSTSTDSAKTSLTFSKCTYQTVGLSPSDPNYAAAGTSCSNLLSLTTGTSGTLYAAPIPTPSPTATAAFTWIPTSTQRGAFQFSLTASDGVANTTSTFTIIVRDSDSGSGINLNSNILLMHMDGTLEPIPNGATILNSSGYSYNSTYNGTANGTGLTYVNGSLNQAIAFNGSSSITGSTASALNAYPLSVMAWVNTTTNDSVARPIISKSVSASNNGWSLHVHNGELCFWYFAGSSANAIFPTSTGLCSTTLVNDGNWHHIAAVVNAQGGIIYIDGVSAGFSPWTGTAGNATSTAHLVIGDYDADTTHYFTGSIDEVAVYSRALSAAEIAGAFSTSTTLSILDANFSEDASGLSTPSSPITTGTATSWLNLLSGVPSSTFGESCTWQGTGQSSNPYSASFLGTASSSMTGGNVLSVIMNKIALEAWVKPNTPSSAGSVIVSNFGSTTGGMSLRQSTYPTGRAEFAVGQKYYSYQDLILSDGPVGFWRLNEASGTIATDLSAFGNTGTYNGGYTLGQTGAHTAGGDNSTSVLFNGSSGYVQAGPTALPTGSAKRSLEAWIKPSALPTSGNQTCWASYGTGTTHNGLSLCLVNNSGTQQITFSGFGDDASWNYTTSTTAWTHMIATYDGTNALVYANGTAIGSAISKPSWNTASSNFTIGMQAWVLDFFSGYIADVALYDYTLSQTQITNHYNTGTTIHGAPYPGNAVLADKPVTYWRLNEESGNTAYDYSGYGNNGIYNGTYTLGQTGALTAGGDTSTSASLDGTSAYIVGSQTVNIPLATVEAWIYPTVYPTSTYGELVGFINGEGQSQSDKEILMDSSGFLYFYGFDGSGHTTSIPSSTVPLNQWSHVVGTANGSNIYVYLNGTQVGSTTCGNTATNYTAPNIIVGGTTVGNSRVFYGSAVRFAEVAIYNYALSQTQITNHYNAGKGPGWWLCQSQTQLSSSNWDFFSTLWDGTNAKLYTNGQLECSVQPNAIYTSTSYTTGQSSTLQVASTPSGASYWDGFLNLLKIFGTSSSVTNPLPSTLPQSDFAATANRFRQQPIENIVNDSSLILHFDAANAQQGTMPYTSTSSIPYTWFDLSASGLNASLGDGTNSIFNNGSSGTFVTNMNWNTSAPYALNNTSGLYAGEINNTASVFSTITTGLTVEAWINVLTPGNEKIIYANSTGGFVMGIYEDGSFCTGQFQNYDEVWVGGSATHYQNNGACFPLNTWTHLAMTFQAGASSGTFTSYKNGSSDVSQSTVSGNISSGFMNPPAFGDIQGQIAIFRIYNRALSATEINQNCNAQQSRFSSSAICASP